MIAHDIVLKVIQTSGACQQLIGRSAAMVLWVAVYSEQINHTHRGTITLDWEGSSLRPKFTSTYDRIDVGTLLPLSDQSSS